MTQSPLSRRTLAKGAAWAVPAVLLAGAAPAYAASPVITSVRQIYTYRGNPSGCVPMTLSTQQNSSGTGDANYFIGWQNTTTSTKLTNISIMFWYAEPNITWISGTQAPSPACWTVPTRVSTATIVDAGVTLYGYQSTYTCAVTAVNGTTYLADFDWQTKDCASQVSGHWGYKLSWTLNGVNDSWQGFGTMT